MLLKKYNVPLFFIYAWRKTSRDFLTFLSVFPYPFFFPVLYFHRTIKKYVYGRKEVAQGLSDGGVRRTFCGEKEMYVVLMAEPTFPQFFKFIPVSKKDEVSVGTLVKDCFIEDDCELVNNDFLFLFGLMGQVTELITTRQSTLIN